MPCNPSIKETGKESIIQGYPQLYSKSEASLRFCCQNKTKNEAAHFEREAKFTFEHFTTIISLSQRSDWPQGSWGFRRGTVQYQKFTNEQCPPWGTLTRSGTTAEALWGSSTLPPISSPPTSLPSWYLAKLLPLSGLYQLPPSHHLLSHFPSGSLSPVAQAPSGSLRLCLLLSSLLPISNSLPLMQSNQQVLIEYEPCFLCLALVSRPAAAL